MKGMKKTIGIVLVIALIAVGIYTFVAVKSETSSEKVQLRMAHGQAADSEIGETMSIYQIWQQKTVPRIWKWIFIRVVYLEQNLLR